MKKFVEKLKQKEIEISQEKGDFALFALFLRGDIQDKWDLLVAAPWIEKDKPRALKYIASIIQKSFMPDELLKIARIVIIDLNNPALRTIHQAVNVEHGSVNVVNCNFFGLNIKNAYLITSSKKHITTQSTRSSPPPNGVGSGG
ncbi:hypothetical protein CEE34_02905 [Candidatus Aerophobetes bacterium Ae_b3a]|nr:MAG: hypothetical protein CEE34_02905 [Candidatus Aerophobetes bacterium Ae_b3a]